MRCGRKAGQFNAQFGEQNQRRAFADAGNQRQVSAEQMRKVAAQVPLPATTSIAKRYVRHVDHIGTLHRPAH